MPVGTAILAYPMMVSSDATIRPGTLDKRCRLNAPVFMGKMARSTIALEASYLAQRPFNGDDARDVFGGEEHQSRPD
ncbi:MAG: hypothetical protein RIQ93_2502 [Verrucomicrobiota bacterium]|jgi:hypothetical protein